MIDQRQLKKINEQFETNKAIKAQIDRVIARIKAQITLLRTQSRLHVSQTEIVNYQFAIRVLESRQRMIDREFLIMYGGDDHMTAAAKLELSLAKPDNGTLFKMRTYNHQQGRLFCSSCDTETDDKGDIKIIARLCPSCKKGIQHVITSLAEFDSASMGIESATQSTSVRVFTCDNCLYTQKYPMQNVEVLQEQPRPAITIDISNRTIKTSL